MSRRALSVISAGAALAAGLLVPVGTGTAAADTSAPVVGVQATFKSGVSQRTRRAQHLAAVAEAAKAAPVASYADRVLAATNAERTARGLAPLAASSCATGFAQSWSAHLASVGGLSHQRLAPILDGCAASTVGENVGYGNVTPEQLVAMWMGSTGHRGNILNPRYTHLGVGGTTTSTGRTYGVQVFLGL